MFPTAASTIHHNDDGEVIGWDTTFDDAPEPDDYADFYDEGDDDEDDDTPFLTEDFDFANEYAAQEDAWLDGSYEE